ncbi:MAG: prepilin-type N-terminal cleavage/methylation domain-containing protein [Planctomycetes bacterium]|nr:prepilin-type N-terminal cleavage/methylation domain-containing protein [Planctomycetota bacterium]
MLQRKNPSEKGFTLVELLVVVAIIATLTALIVPAVMNALKNARMMECGNNLLQLNACLLKHKDVFGAYPKPGSPDFWNKMRGLPDASPIVSDNRLFFCKLAGFTPDRKDLTHLDYTYPAGDTPISEASDPNRVIARDKVKNHGTADCINVLFYQGSVDRVYNVKAEYAEIIEGKAPFGPQAGDEGK